LIEKLIEKASGNKLLVMVFVAMGIMWGVYAIRNIPLDAIPDLSDVQVIILTEWPGRSPDLVEDQVTYPIVTSMLAVPKVKVVRGMSFFGLSFVYILFEDGTDMYWARSRVLEYMTEVQSELPEGAKASLGPDATGVGWVYQYALADRSGNHSLDELRSLQDWTIRYLLESVPGVAEVASVGGFVRQYQIVVDPESLEAHRVAISDIARAVRSSNNDVGGRVIEMSGKEFFIRGRGYIKNLDDIRNIMVKTGPDGTPVTVGDLAQVRFGPDIRRGAADLNGEGEVVGGIVVMRHGENALKVIERVKERLKDIEKGLPPGVEIVETYDRSELIKRSIDTLTGTLTEEMIVVSVIIILFLLHVPSALVAIIMLPIAVLLAFIPMYHMGITSNIMSLGGIAIAIGAMVDAAVVLIENAHKRIERAAGDKTRAEIITNAAKEVGRPIFYSLIIITVSFLPVFALQAQEGRLFKPLAYTKTFSMFFAAVLSITLVPALMGFFVRGKIKSENENPVSRLLIRVYAPLARFFLKIRWPAIAVAVLIMLGTVPVYMSLGSEFMPPLNEGSILYMPTTPPGISIEEAKKLLQTQDMILSDVPEVKSVFGKVGRAESATDPAPLNMVETTILLKPKSQWRHSDRWYSSWAPEFVKKALRRFWPERITWKELISDLDRRMQFPGVVNAWTMPIKTRIDMLTTGIKTPVGIKIIGPDLEVIERIGMEIESALPSLEGTRSVYAERVTGGYFIDIIPNREVISRYGLTVEKVENVIQTAVGGMNIDYTVEGRERYPINIRYPRDYRSSPEALEAVRVSTPTGAQVPLGQLADISMVTGPPVIKNENGQLTGWVYVDLDTSAVDVGTYVERAKKAVEENVETPPGYFLQWTGQYEFLERMRARMKVLLPVTALLVLLLLYFNFRQLIPTLIVVTGVWFALVGSFWLMFALGYNMSVAVWVGIIALLGVAAETGVVMLVYLDEYYEEYGGDAINDESVLKKAVLDGSVQRVRPKMMTVTTTVIALLPLLWSTGAGADVMKRIAAPMIGGLITSTVLTLLIIPAVYFIWKSAAMKRRLRKGT